ncbi:LamG domain-containing protein [Paraflavitalea soli]|uniref:LamG domain-containing protein n=1 Tax=Paraflavitalea soli TaxID=2315862 RepID=A0A3B7MR08_9BACT|nr:LamG domain-containing protein [Paraflavitalea soli]AXY75749.1 LamG domain-containing protein [Paraflavitalea soli]
MKYLKIVSGSLLLYFLFFSTGTQLVSCQKEPIYDTVIIKDTITIRDTVDCNCYDLKDGLVAWYNFKGGNLNDSSGKNNHIVFNNATTTADRFGNANGAYLFNGTSSYMRVANSSSLNPPQAITLAAVVKINDFYRGECHGNQILGKSYFTEYSNGYYALRVSDQVCNTPVDLNKEKFSGAYGDNQGGGPYALTDTVFAKTGQWYNIVYTYENGHSKIYINGELKDTRDIAKPFTPNPADVFFGKNDNSQYPYFFNGVIDDIRIYNRALCDGEVKQLNRGKD